MKTPSWIRLRLLHGLAWACGVPTFIYGLNQLLAAAGSPWSSIERTHPTSQLLAGLVLIGAGSLCAWTGHRLGRVVRRMQSHRDELPLRALFVRGQELRDEALRSDSATPQAPKHV